MKKINLTKMLIYTIPLLTVHVCAWSQNNNKTTVVGGGNAASGAYPWMSKLQYSPTGFAGGALIAPQWVITAGHCVKTAKGDPKTVYVNMYSESNKPANAELHTVAQVFLHPGYSNPANLSSNVDLALIKLDKPSLLPTIPIAHANAHDSAFYKANTKCKVLGWGFDDTVPLQQFNGKDTLKEGNITLFDFTTCNNAYSILGPSYICAGYSSPSPAEGAAVGDSGGPLFVADGTGWKIIGVVSGGKGPTTTDKGPGLYAKLINYAAWVDSVILANSTSGIAENLSLEQYINFYCTGSDLKFNISTSVNDKFQLCIYDAAGKLMRIADFNVSIGEQTLNVNNLSSGLYSLQISSSKGNYYRAKFIKPE